MLKIESINIHDYRKIKDNSFLNSLYIEAGEHSLHSTDQETKKLFKNPDILKDPHYLIIHNKFLIGINRISKTHQHSYSDHCYLLQDETLFPTSFEIWRRELIQFCANQNHAERFLNRILASEKNIQDEIRKNPTPISFPMDFQQSENSLILGHYAHPYPKVQECPKSNESTLVNEKVDLIWLLVKKELLHIESATTYQKAQEELVTLAQESEVIIPDNFLPYPVHPIQWNALFDSYFCEKLMSGEIVKTDKTKTFYPTTSVRSLYKKECKWQLKFSLDLLLTNSIRHLKLHEVQRGMQLYDLKKDIVDKNNFEIIHEPFFLALKQHEEVLDTTIVVFRENTFKNSENDICLAVLTQAIASGGKTLLRSILDSTKLSIDIWYESFLINTLAPILKLQMQEGILLGAHQQNLILKLDSNFTIQKTYYRDAQGTGYSDLYYKKHLEKKQHLNHYIEKSKNVLPLEAAQILLSYYIFINSTAGVIKALSIESAEEEKLIKNTQNFLRDLLSSQQNSDHRFINFILSSPFLTIKNNFRCCLQNINENTMENPFSLYQNFKNPFYQKGTNPMGMTQTNGIPHPIRPAFYEGQHLYSSKLKHIDKTLSIRIIDRKIDLDIFHQWHNQKRVSYFWELDKSKIELYDYLSKGLNDPHQMPVILSFDDEPVGYFEIYWTKEDRLGPYYAADDFDRGFHLLVGNMRYLGKENTDAILRHVCRYIFESEPKTQSIMGEPRHDNTKLLKYLESFKAWTKIKEFNFPHKRAVLLRCDRTLFYNGNNF